MPQKHKFDPQHFIRNLSLYREVPELREQLVDLLTYLGTPRVEASRLIDRMSDQALREAILHAAVLYNFQGDKHEQ